MNQIDIILIILIMIGIGLIFLGYGLGTILYKVIQIKKEARRRQ